MYKTIFFIAILAALIPGIKAAQHAATGYSHMQKTVFAMSDPMVMGDYARFKACAAAAQGEVASLAGIKDAHTINADPAQCQHPTGTGTVSDGWVAVR